MLLKVERDKGRLRLRKKEKRIKCKMKKNVKSEALSVKWDKLKKLNEPNKLNKLFMAYA